MIKRYLLHIFLLFALFWIVTGNVIAQDSDANKAIWVVQNFMPNVYWTNESAITAYTIGVFGAETQLFDELTALAMTKRLVKGKTFSVVQFKKLKEITPVNVLFVEMNANDEIKSIYEKLPENTLLITDQCPNLRYSMINMLPPNPKKRFETNSENALERGITFGDDILVHGGNEKEIKTVYNQAEAMLLKEQKKLEKQREELAKQTSEFENLKIQNDREKQENERQQFINKEQIREMQEQQKLIEEQRAQMEVVQRNLAVLQEKLNANSSEVKEQIKKINIQEVEVDKRKLKIQEQIDEIQKNNGLIKDKDNVLTIQSSRIEIQLKILFGFLVLMLAVLVLVFFIWRGYKVKQKINEELRVKNDAINKQKEEISRQQYHTELLHKELEKLSIVASKTDNAVTIMDIHGNFEWINVGYTRLYGYTLQLLRNELDENIKGVNENPLIADYIQQCVSDKKSVVFESRYKKRNGTEIWVQTSMTPILDSENKVSKLITIETDISGIKNAEKEIRIQNEKILEQTIELESSNKELEKLSLVASGTDNAIAILDSAGNFQWINEGFSRLYGYSYNQLISEFSRNIIAINTPSNVQELIKECIEQTRPVTYELLQKTRDGKDIWVQNSLTPITDKLNNIKFLISISIDISQLKKAEQAIRLQSEELMAQKEELIIQKDQIELQNQNIRASISYAKTIQNAILPTLASVNLDYDAFIIYKPKDIVSGDFYWYSKALNGRYYYAAVDCTGHGVPGAFMSMIGSRILNEIINEKKVSLPSKILENMNKEIKSILKQDESDNIDGMDVCLCELDPTYNGNVKITFAGAKRPIYYYSKDKNELKYIKGTRKTIGGTQAIQNSISFKDHEIELKKGDIIYLTTDGIVEQPSDEIIKYGSLRFFNLLKSLADKPLPVQKEVIEQSLSDFQKSEQQRDDITVIGIKL